MSSWEPKEMLIWCQTHPALSSKYTETVCTGAVELGNSQLLRLYPLVLRGLGSDARHKKWSVITAQVKKTTKDNRPESWRINNDSIEFIERYKDTGDNRRGKELFDPQNIVTFPMRQNVYLDKINVFTNI